MRFKRVVRAEWLSDCGRYVVWVQERPRDEGCLYAASRVESQFTDGGKRAAWLVERAGSFKEACDACRDDARRRDS